MGTYWNIELSSEKISFSGPHIERVIIETLEKYDSTFSDWRDQSELSRLEKGFTKWQAPTSLFLEGLQLAYFFYTKSNHLFDITTGAISWKKSKFPVGMNNLTMDKNKFRFKEDPLKLSFGGFVKGMVIGALADYFHKAGLESFRIDGGGGNLAVKGLFWNEARFYNLKESEKIYFISRSYSRQGENFHIFHPQNKKVEESYKVTIICQSNEELRFWGAYSDMLSTLLVIDKDEFPATKYCYEFTRMEG